MNCCAPAPSYVGLFGALSSGGFPYAPHYAGQFVFLHVVALDSTGNVYTAEVGGGRRVQKFVRRQ